MTMPASLVARGALLAGFVHAVGFVLFASVVLYLAFVPVAQWQMTWLYLEPIDWPVSQLIWWGGWPRQHITWLPYQLSDPLWFFIPCFVFGVLGTLWYSLLGSIIGGVVGTIRPRQRQVQHRG
jgi:hypothetical protein